jgi:magnesium transporter
MIERLVLPEVRELLASGELETLGEVLSGWPAADLAGIVTALGEEEETQIFQALRGRVAAETFEYLDLAVQERLLATFDEAKAAAVLDEMAPDDRTALLEELPDATAERLLALLSPQERDVAVSLLQYAPDSVGRLMTPDFVAVRKDWTIRHVFDHVRAHGKDSETLNVVYVVDPQGTLVDDLRIRTILLAPFHVRVSDIMDGKYVALNVTDDKASAVDVFRKYDRTALPVIDERNKLVGIVTIDDVLDVAEEEATREIQRFGGLEALDEPYLATPLGAMVRKRASWLVILFLSEMLTATAMGFFEKEIARAVVLALFVPLIISSGGNSGSQAATLIIRALALGEVKFKDWWRVMRREIASGIMLGAILGSIGFLRIALWSAFSNLYGPHWILIGLTVGLSLLGIVLWGSLSGSMLPLVLHRLGFDPAASSAPFVATLVDVTGLIIYFSVAIVILGGTLLKG